MRIRLQLLANQNWRSNGCYQSLACAPGSGYENGGSLRPGNYSDCYTWNCLRTSVYRKPTNTSRLLDKESYHPISHKSATVSTLVKKAHEICSPSEAVEEELQQLHKAFTTNKYPKQWSSHRR